MCYIARIEAFLREWPDADSGPGHVVLSDANIEDDNIDWCIALTEACLDDAKVRPEDREYVEQARLYHDRDELEATLAFLRAYRAMPEDERTSTGDHFCPSPEDWKRARELCWACREGHPREAGRHMVPEDDGKCSRTCDAWREVWSKLEEAAAAGA